MNYRAFEIEFTGAADTYPLKRGAEPVYHMADPLLLRGSYHRFWAATVAMVYRPATNFP